MAATAIQQGDIDRALALIIELDNIMVNGATVAGNPVINGMYPSPPTPSDQALIDNFYKALSVSLMRINRGNPTPFPTYVPSFTLATLPNAAVNTGNLIFVSNATGGSVICFSDGVNWRLVSTRAIVA